MLHAEMHCFSVHRISDAIAGQLQSELSAMIPKLLSNHRLKLPVGTEMKKLKDILLSVCWTMVPHSWNTIDEEGRILSALGDGLQKEKHEQLRVFI